MKSVFLISIISSLFSIQSFAADFYWVGGNGNWSDYTIHWATASGGSNFHTNAPTASDNVFFDNNSGLGIGTMVSLTTTSNCKDMNWTGSGSTIFNMQNKALNISGSLTLQSQMSFTSSTATITFNSSNQGNTIKTNGITITSNVTFNGTGGWIFQDPLNVNSYNITFTNGNLNFNGQSVILNSFISTGGNTTRQLNISNSTIDVNNWTYSGGATISATNSLIKAKTNFTGKNGDNYDIVEAGTGVLTAGNFNKIVMNKGFGTLNSTSTGVINTNILEFTVAGGYGIYGGSTVNVNNNLSKTNTELSTLKASTTTSQAIINMGSSSTVNMNAVGLQNIKITGPGVNYPTSGGYDMGGNAGWQFSNTIPVDMNTYFWRGGLRDGTFNNIDNWELGYPGSGIYPTVIFGPNNNICFPLDANNPATMTVTTKNGGGGISFNDFHFNATQNITLDLGKFAHTGSGKMYVNSGTFNLTNSNNISYFTISDSLVIKEGGTLSINQIYGSFGSTSVNGTLAHIRSYDHTLIWKDLTVNGNFSSTNTGYTNRVTFTNGVIVNSGGSFMIQPAATAFGTDNYTIGNPTTGGNLTINGTGKVYLLNDFSTNNTTNINFNGSIIDPNGNLTANKVNGIYFQSSVAHTLDLILPNMPNITNSGLFFNSPLGYTMSTPFNIPTNSVYIDKSCGSFNSGGNNIICNIFGITANNNVANTILNLNGSRLYIQQYLDKATNYNQQSATTALIFTSPSMHYLNFEGIKTFQSIAFTNSAPSAQINSITTNPILNTDTLILDVKKIEFDNINYNDNNLNVTTNISVKVNQLMDIMQAFDLYPTNEYRNNYRNRTTSLSVNKILEHSNACNTRSKIYTTGNNGFTFNTLTPITSQNIAFEHVQFTGAGLTTSKTNDLGGNSGSAINWTAAITGQTYYWIGGTGNWLNPNNWSLTSGGTPSTGCIPTAADDVVFDCNSFSTTNQAVTIDTVSAAVHHITWDTGLTGCGKKGYMEGNTLIITGSADFTGCDSINALINFATTGSEKITTGGMTFTRNINFAHSGDYTLVDNLSSNMDIFHNSGGIIAKNDSIHCRIFTSRSFDFDSASARWYDFTNTKISVKHLINSTDIFNLNLDNLDVSRSTFTGSHIYTLDGGIIHISGGGTVVNSVTLYDLSATGTIAIDYRQNVTFNNVDIKPNDLTTKNLNAFTCQNLLLKAGRNYSFNKTSSPTIYIIKGSLTTDASNCSPETNITSAQNPIDIQFVNNPSTILKAKVSRVRALTNSLIVNAGTDGGSNTNVVFNDIETPGIDYYWVGGTGNWNDPMHWSIGISGGNPTITNSDNCIPTSKDNVFFDINSFTGINQQVTLDLTQNNCKNMTWTADAGAKTPILYSSSTQNLNVYGSSEFTTGMKIRCDYTYGMIINMLGTDQTENAQYLKFNGFFNSSDNDCKFRMFFSGGGRYDLLDDITRMYSHSTACITISANSSFYSHGNNINTSGPWVINGGGTTPSTVDISNSEIRMTMSYYQAVKFNFTIDNNRTLITTNSHIYSYSGATINNQSSHDIQFHNVYFSDIGATITSTSSNLSYNTIFNKIEFYNNSNIAGTATIVTDTLQYAFASTNQIEAGKKIIVNEKLMAPASPCAKIEIKSTTTTPAFLSSGNCDMTLNFAKLSYITADISNGCTTTDYQLYGDLSEQTGITNWTFTDVTGNDALPLGNDTILSCAYLPYIQTTESFGQGDLYTWQYKFSSGDAWKPYKSGTMANGTDTVHIMQSCFLQLKVDYGSGACFLSSQRQYTVVDTVKPKVICPEDLIVNNDPGKCTYLNAGTAIDANVIEDCDLIKVWYVLGGATTGIINPVGNAISATLDNVTFNQGKTTITCYARDSYLNEGFCIFNIEVEIPNTTINGTNTLCSEDITTFTAVNNAGSNYIWDVDGGIISSGANTNKIDVSWTTGGTKKVSFIYLNANGCQAKSDTAYVHIIPIKTTWIPGNNSTDWNLAANWDNGVPGPCSYVIIPDGTTNPFAYPVLTATTSPAAVCDTIEFKFGGEIAGTNYLAYNGAKTELTFLGNRWYMFSPPLQKMFPGDFYVNNPNPFKDYNPHTSGYGLFAYTQLFAHKNPQTGAQDLSQQGSWTGSFNTPNVGMEPGFGFAVWVDDGTEMDVQNPTTMAFPKHDNSYNYYNGPDSFYDNTGPLNRNGLENRFIYEATLNNSNGNITLATPNTAPGKYAIVGNPFMAHWDFNQFYQQNIDKIKNEYKIMASGDDGAFTTYFVYGTTVVSPEINVDQFIAPMQSIIVTADETNGITTPLVTNVSSVTTRPGSKLRASSEILINQLTITASMEKRTNKTTVIYTPEANNNYKKNEDSYKLFVSGTTNPVVAYTRSHDGYALDVNIVGDDSKSIPFGIRTSKEGKIEIEFEISESFTTNYNIQLFDVFENKSIILENHSKYSFNKVTKDEFLDGRFFLIFNKRPTGIDHTEDTSILINTYGDQVHVISNDGSNLKTVEIYDTQGKLIHNAFNLNQFSYNKTITKHQLYIIKATNERSSIVKKIMIGK